MFLMPFQLLQDLRGAELLDLAAGLFERLEVRAQALARHQAAGLAIFAAAGLAELGSGLGTGSGHRVSCAVSTLVVFLVVSWSSQLVHGERKVVGQKGSEE